MRTWTPDEIRELRKRYKLSKAKLGELTGVSKNYIYYLEKGERTPSKTVKIVLDFVEKQLRRTKKKKGVDMAEPKERKQLPKGIYKRGGVYWIRYAGLDGKIVFESAKQGQRPGTKIKDAEDLLHERKADIGRGKQPEIKKRIPSITFKELSAEYPKWAKRQRSFDQKETLINQLVTIFGAYPLRAFNTRLLEQYQTERMEKSNKRVKNKPQGGNKPGTINRYLATIKHMLTKGAEWEMVEEEVLKRVRKVKLPEENNRRLRYLSKEECQNLVSKCSSHLRPIVITALNTGMRRGEILSLEWANVDLKHGFILLDKTKNGERREIPVNETLRATLTSIERRLDLPYVFYNRDTDLPYGDIKNAFNRACKNAEIKDFHFHDLRHSSKSLIIPSGPRKSAYLWPCSLSYSA